jgi:hypothetical protein
MQERLNQIITVTLYLQIWVNLKRFILYLSTAILRHHCACKMYTLKLLTQSEHKREILCFTTLFDIII